MSEACEWWREGVIYQIYPRSFADSNGDGFGDLPGITSRLDYLSALGIDAIWLSPFYPSPDADFGYDISNYTDVDPRYGTLADFDELLAQAHQRNIRVVLDMVMNHTSDRHPWFLESRASGQNPRRDWYIWKDPAPGGRPPNNWAGSFGGSAWTLDPATGQYYLHSFLPQQPDLNWRNPDVRQAVLDAFRFWLERGVDGFRLDVFNAYFKDAAFRDNPGRFGLRRFDRQVHLHDMDQPELLPFLAELRALLDSYPERYMVGETYLATPQKTTGYAGPGKLHAAFSFDFFTDGLSYPWNANWVKERIQAREENFDRAGIWPTTVLGNHDVPRTASRYARGEDDHQTLLAMTLLLTLRGTPFMYYGEEIGMRDISLSRGQIQDPPGKHYWPIYKGRDGCRAPMQWDASPNAGFSTARPWLPLHPDYPRRNLAAQQADPNSLWNYTHRLLALRRATPALLRGDFRVFYRSDSGVLAYERQASGSRVLVYLNFTGSPRPVSLARDADPKQAAILLCSAGRQSFHATHDHFVLAPYEALLLELKMP